MVMTDDSDDPWEPGASGDHIARRDQRSPSSEEVS
jgi:hypothetical protein